MICPNCDTTLIFDTQQKQGRNHIDMWWCQKCYVLMSELYIKARQKELAADRRADEDQG